MDSFMTIAYVERNKKGLTINCSGPDGNAFQLLRTASDLGKQMGKTQKQIDKILTDLPRLLADLIRLLSLFCVSPQRKR